MIHTARHRLKHLAKTRVGPFVARRQPRRVDLSPDRWGLSIGPTGTLWSGDVDLDDLARSAGTPLHVVSAEALDRNAAESLGSPDQEHRTDVFYSYKTNPVPAVLRRLHDAGIGAEVISPYELWLAFRLGVPAERIIYNGPAKSKQSIRTAVERGVFLLNANSVSDAATIAAIAEDVGTPVNMGLRVALPGMWGGQFGISSSSPAVVDAVRTAQRQPFVTLRALHVHRGLTIRSADTLRMFVQSVLDQCDSLRQSTGWHPEMLDLGGSLACPTVAGIPTRQFRLNRALGSDLLPPDPADTVTLGEAATIMASMVDSHFRAAGVATPKVIQEPGRALTGNTQLLLASVIDVKDDGELPHAVLDAGINVAEAVPNEYHQLFSVTAPSAPPIGPYRLVGPICTPADVLYHNWRLPELQPGHVLAIMDSGAYFVPFSTSFSFPRPGIVMQDGGTITTGRRTETFDDLVGNDVMFEEPIRS